MAEDLLPLFPLELVLLPHAPLPLHIFEERYKEMIGSCIRQESEFGVVQARGNGILRTGCTATVEEVLKQYDDGRMDILALGRRRFEIVEVDTSLAYVQASVAFFGDDDFREPNPVVIQKAHASAETLMRLSGQDEELPEATHPELSFHLGQLSPDLDFRQTLLTLRSEADRMERVAEHLSELIARQQTRETMKKIAKQNGHGAAIKNLDIS